MTVISKLTPWLAAGAFTVGSLVIACDDSGDAATGGGAPGTGGTTSAATTDGATSTAAPASQAAMASSTASGMSTFDCNPPAEPGSIYELEDNIVFPPFEPISMCQFRGDVMFIFNAAAL